MAQENMETVNKEAQTRAVMDAINDRDFDRLAELLHPEQEFHSLIGRLEGRRAYFGIAGMRDWAQDIDATWEEFRGEMVEFHEVNDEQAVVVNRIRGKATGSGVPLDVRIGMVWTWREGRPWRNVSYSDPREAFRAAGLRE